MNAELREQCKCGLAAEVLQSSGKLTLRATGASMLPTLWPGDVLTIQYNTLDQVALGDVVLFVREGRFFVHRVVSKPKAKDQQTFLVTRGDCMLQADQPVSSTELLGRVTHVERECSCFGPVLKLNQFRRLFAWMLSHCDLLQRIALRLHGLRVNSGSHFEAAVARLDS
jgi:signal peptidase I